jgi:hypothetical protein
MPYDDSGRQRALDAIEPQRDAFRSALVVTVEQLRASLDADAPSEAGPGDRAAAQLGRFASGRVDPQLFAQLISDSEPEDSDWLGPASLALETLESVAARGEDLFLVQVDSGEDLYAAVDVALAEAGRAFGAARVVELARTGRYVSARHDTMLDAFPFRRWSRTERDKAPPLLVEVDGGDMIAGSLAGFLDGGVKIILLVRGGSPPAPLARLVTPGVLVMQTNELDELALVGKATGPAIAALVSPEAGHFVHEPAEGGTRLEVSHLPETEPGHALGQVSAFQQAEELRLLRSLAAGEPEPLAKTASQIPVADGTRASSGAEPPAQPVDVLAAWLLRQADLTDLDPAVDGGR